MKYLRTAVIGGDNGGISLAYGLSKKGFPKQNIVLFDDLGQTKETVVVRPIGPIESQCYRELGLEGGHDPKNLYGHYVWGEAISHWTVLLTFLFAPLQTVQRIWAYSCFVYKSIAYLTSNLQDDMTVEHFCSQWQFRSIYEEYIRPLIIMVWVVDKSQADQFDARRVFLYMHKRNFLQIWSPQVLQSRKIRNLTADHVLAASNCFTHVKKEVISIKQNKDNKWRINDRSELFDQVVLAISSLRLCQLRVEDRAGGRPEVISLITSVPLVNYVDGEDRQAEESFQQIETPCLSSPFILNTPNAQLSERIMHKQGDNGLWVTGAFLRNGLEEDVFEDCDFISKLLHGGSSDLFDLSQVSNFHKRYDLPISATVNAFLKSLAAFVLDRMIVKGCIGIVYPDSSIKFFGQKKVPVSLLYIHRMRSIFYLVFLQSIGFGMAYREQHMDTNNLTLLLNYLIINTNVANGISQSRLFSWTIYLFSLPFKFALWLRLGVNVTVSRRNVIDHYSLDDKLFELFLDETRAYSSAYFKEGSEDLYNGQLGKMDLIIDKLDLNDGERVLDIGCGWGHLMLRMCYRKSCTAVGITNCPEHVAFCSNIVKKLDISDRIKLHETDYRNLPTLFKHDKFDKISCIESVEHVGPDNLKDYFKAVSSILNQNGKFVAQAICRFEDNYDYYKKDPDFFNYYIFPGGCLPSLGVLCKHASREGLVITDITNISEHYRKTQYMWRDNFNRSVLNGKMPYDIKFAKIWNIYLALSEACFGSNILQDHVITFEKIRHKSTSYLNDSPISPTSDL